MGGEVPLLGIPQFQVVIIMDGLGDAKVLFHQMMFRVTGIQIVRVEVQMEVSSRTILLPQILQVLLHRMCFVQREYHPL